MRPIGIFPVDKSKEKDFSGASHSLPVELIINPISSSFLPLLCTLFLFHSGCIQVYELFPFTTAHSGCQKCGIFRRVSFGRSHRPDHL